jgi:5-methylthioribose kinase
MTDAARHVEAALPDRRVTGRPQRLPEGNLNVVWRVPTDRGPVVVKHAPPYIAADPTVPLDPSRLVIEARALEALAPGGRLQAGASEAVRPPCPIDADLENYVLIMEDAGAVPTLGRWLREAPAGAVQARAPAVGRRLGRFVGTLHRRSRGDEALTRRFDNRAMQETRLQVQYRAVGEMLARGGVDDAAALGRRAEALGERLLKTGRCLTMGDLWPPSVLVREGDLRVIDWELAHYGRPLQDVAHFRAHCWMQAHRAPSPARAEAVEALEDAFLSAYRDALSPAADDLLPGIERAGPIHAGAEILVRAVGRFQPGFLYDGLAPDHPAVQEAVAHAADQIREGRLDG